MTDSLAVGLCIMNAFNIDDISASELQPRLELQRIDPGILCIAETTSPRRAANEIGFRWGYFGGYIY